MKKKNWYFFLNFNQYYYLHVKNDIQVLISHKTKLNKIKITINFLKKKSEIKNLSLKIFLIIDKIVKTIGFINMLKYNIVTTHVINIITNDSIEKYIRGQVSSTTEKQIYKSNSILLVHNNEIDDLIKKTKINTSNDKNMFINKIITTLYNNIINTLHNN